MSKQRGIFRMIFNNFINSIRPKQIRGNFMGKDQFGNEYYEIPTAKPVMRGRPSRWFVPPEKDNFEHEMPAEWEAWLRGRRSEPPTSEEVMKNFAVSELKKKNAAEIEEKEPSGKPKPIKEGTTPFPTYKDYESDPSKNKK